MSTIPLLLLALLVGDGPEPGAPEEPVLTVPEGFLVEKVAGPPLVDRPIMGCFDPEGRLYVGDSSGVNLKFEDLLKSPPHRILRLTDTRGQGTFDQATVFADGITFPMGALFHRGGLYVCAPPSVWRFDDIQDGVARRRTEIVTKFGSNGNAADVHGPFLHPSGRLYWSDGRHGHQIRTSDGTTMSGLAARIFRAREDGREIEVVCGGGMDNPVEIAFTEEGEALVTVALLHASPRRVDSIIHAVWGGVFPYHESLKEFKRTGDLLPSVTDVGWVAPAGLLRYRGLAFGPEYKDNFFSAQFNTHKIQRHVIERDGATFKSRNEDFLVSTHPDFHPTDVLEDADGSLLVLDTGGWFRIGCPTSRVDKPNIKGAIYRVRRKLAPALADPWGRELFRESPAGGPAARLSWLGDERPFVRDRAIEAIAEDLGKEAPAEGPLLRTVRQALKENPSAQVRRNLVWTLSRVDLPEARSAGRSALADRDPGVRNAAAYVAGLHRDAGAFEGLELLLKDELPALRREAATALGRLRSPRAIGGLFEALRAGGDRFLEHALIYALIEIGNPEATRAGLADPSSRVRKGALIALDQMDGGRLTREEVTPNLDPSDPALQQAALGILQSRGWASETLGLLREWLADPAPRPELGGILAAFARETSVQDLVAQTLRRPTTSPRTRILLLETISRASVERLPATWSAELRWSLESPDEGVVRQAVSTLRALGVREFEEALLGIARDPARPEELRVEALAQAAGRLPKLEPGLFTFLLEALGAEKPALLRLGAAQALGQAALTEAQLGSLAKAVEQAGAMELPRLLGAYERSTAAATGKRLLAALEKSAVQESLSPEVLRGAIRNYPQEIRQAALPLLKKLEVDTEKMKARLSELEPVLQGGDPARGREVFFGKKVSCMACHTAGGQGGRVGPELSKIGQIRSGRDLLESIVFPSASFVRGYEPYLIRTKDGAILDGLIARETAEAIFLVQADRTERRVARSSIEAIRQGKVSIMPQGLDLQISREELRDLIAFLLSLK
jgi:putative membrane-bound dehydrogenase-like protein